MSAALIGAAALMQRLHRGGEPPVLIDTSFDLADPAAGERSFEQAHVPGALYWHLDRELSDPERGNPRDVRFRGRHPLPARAALAAHAGRAGIRPGREVVVYDRQGTAFAARAWWLLRWLGHAEVSVLDGGLPAWQAAGGALEQGPARPVEAAPPYPEATPLARTLDAKTLLQRLGNVRLIDARAAERFRGDVEPLDPVAGHIPGALNRPFKDNLDPSSGCFLPRARLREAFAPLIGDSSPADVVHQCGSGVTACHNLLAMEAAGLPGATLYPGSWSQWCADPARPVARG